MAPGYTIGEAKTNLSRLVRLAEAGEEVVLRRGDRPVARILPLPEDRKATQREPGRMRGRVELGDDFDDWPEDVAAALGMRE